MSTSDLNEGIKGWKWRVKNLTCTGNSKSAFKKTFLVKSINYVLGI